MITEFSKRVDVPATEILGRSRRRPISDARLLYRYILYLCGYSSLEVARLCGCNHSVVINGNRRVKGLLTAGDEKMTRMYEATKGLKYERVKFRSITNSKTV
jgi:chromosomal replication initiation ATPase DnaA